jgi:hypothetical protein
VWHSLNRLLFIAIPLAFATPLHSTTVVVLSRDGQIYISADGRRDVDVGGVRSAISACKTNQYGSVVVAHYGIAGIPVPTDSNGHFITGLDADAISRKAALGDGSLSDKVARLEGDYWKDYEMLVKGSVNWNPVARTKLLPALSQSTLVMAGKGRNGLPEAIVLDFYTHFNQRIPVPQKGQLSIPYDQPWVVLGPNDVKFDPPATGNPEAYMLDFLKRVAAKYPDMVGPPYSVVRLGSSGISFDKAGACQPTTSKPGR